MARFVHVLVKAAGWYCHYCSNPADAAEQFGHARTSAIREQLDKKIIQTKKALTRIKVGKYGICEDCGDMIDTDRLIAYPESTLCADCKIKTE